MIDFLHHPETERIIQSGLQEDLGPGDYTSLSTIPAGKTAKAKCLIKDHGVVAGIAIAEKIFHAVDADLNVEVLIADGQPVKYGDIALTVEGDPRSITMAERLVLNIMQRMSGIATYTRNVVEALEGSHTRVLDTRKTTPLIRHLEKWAVAIGGGTNHRFGLYDMIMIKDNHIDYAGSITAAVRDCVAYLADNQLDLKIEVETRDLKEVQEALDTGKVDRILLDNMSNELMTEAVALVDGRCETEASGGITIERIPEIAQTGVTFVSMGALTHSVKSLDISLKAM
ncbi:carboxylating nicotinate-nucleotide diphosphorylase [Pontibacter sp. G13]|uniref:carboxylating nicotinate-nucleotide diphosphorylase n=1 Tax=Pontibacter sp. G13 TaxID=3074898 RepID=UPI00288B77C9|nr:carboxylating nicotinate-nucleotide diphosphorylase [Pontibacter sp. G13]WNJ17607.1 carboxylating nicotinate-nucleotide diphosphorylase [Pontibacter sp. G13]